MKVIDEFTLGFQDEYPKIAEHISKELYQRRRQIKNIKQESRYYL